MVKCFIASRSSADFVWRR